MAKVISVVVPEWVDEEEIRSLVTNYIEKKILGFSNSVDRITYLKLLELMGISEEDVEFELEKELEFLRRIRKKDKERVLGGY